MFLAGQEVSFGILLVVSLLGFVILAFILYTMNLFMKLISGVEKVVILEEVEMHELDRIHNLLLSQKGGTEPTITLPVSKPKKRKIVKKKLVKKKSTAKPKRKTVKTKSKSSKKIKKSK